MAEANLTFVRAGRDQARPVYRLALICAKVLTRAHGDGAWSNVRTLPTVRDICDEKAVYLAMRAGKPVATFTLADRYPGFIRSTLYSPPEARMLWLSGMFVHPDHHRQGIGRQCLAEIVRLTREARCDVVRFDCFVGPAGAAPFYHACGATCVADLDVFGMKLHLFELRV